MLIGHAARARWRAANRLVPKDSERAKTMTQRHLIASTYLALSHHRRIRGVPPAAGQAVQLTASEYELHAKCTLGARGKSLAALGATWVSPRTPSRLRAPLRPPASGCSRTTSPAL